eukprot:10379408-Alexandrium_andersonii.AAC.1
MAIGQVSIHRLRGDVRWVLLARPFQQGEVPGAHALLHPQSPNCEVPDPPNAGATADPVGRGAIRADLKGGREPEVLGNGRRARTICCALGNACQLGLAGAQSN